MSTKPRRFYVYALVDPRDGEPFYIGKGKGKRAWSHIAKWRKGQADNAAKFERMSEIDEAGHEVVVSILKDDMVEVAAYDLERDLISKHSNLTNAVPGQTCSEAKGYAEGVEFLRNIKPFEKWRSERKRSGCEIINYQSAVATLLDDLTALSESIGIKGKHKWPVAALA